MPRPADAEYVQLCPVDSLDDTITGELRSGASVEEVAVEDSLGYANVN